MGYSDDSLSTKCDYKYQLSIYMEANVSMAQMFVNDFIIYDSDKRYLTTADLDRLTQEQLRLVRNEIYVHKGRCSILKIYRIILILRAGIDLALHHMIFKIILCLIALNVQMLILLPIMNV